MLVLLEVGGGLWSPLKASLSSLSCLMAYHVVLLPVSRKRENRHVHM